MVRGLTGAHLDDIETLLDLVFRDAQDAVGVSEDNVIRVANPALLRMFRVADREALLGRRFFELLDPSERARIGAFVERRAQGAAVPGLYVVRARREDDTTFDMEVRTTTFEWRGRSLALALLRDLGLAEHSADRLYREFFVENTAVKLLIDPADGSIVDANEAAVAFYGWSADRLKTLRMSDINTLAPEQIAHELEEARQGRRRYFRFRHRTASGTVRSVEVHTGGVELRGRRLLLSIVQDVSERDALQERVRQAEHLEAIGRLAGGVAHDFNNLLVIMTSCAEQLGEAVPAEDRGPLVDLMQAARRAGALTRELLAVGRRQKLVPKPVRLDRVVLESEGLLRRAVGPGVGLTVTTTPATVELDPGQLDQILLNLVVNGAEATGGLGRVEVEVARVEPLRDDGFSTGFAVLRVRDDGLGMDEETRARVFEPFFSTKGDRGRGLGLASVQGIVDQSGGHVTVESRLGSGSVFSAFFPEHSGVPRPRSNPPTAMPAQIWLVDDEHDLREVLAEALTHAGFAVRAFSGAEAAMAAAEETGERPRLLVTDMVMPGHSGTALAEFLRSRDPAVRVLVISGDLSYPTPVVLPSGVAFLQKPFTGVELVRAVRGVLGAA